MLSIKKAEIENMDTRYRVNFINSLSGFKSLNLIGTVDRHGNTNLAPFSSVVHLGASPALVGMICRPDSVDRHTLDNLIEMGWYTLNHVHADITQQAHQCSARYAKNHSEFSASGLTELYEANCLAPFVAESRLRLGVQYREHHHLAINGTVMVIGEIMQVHLPEGIIRDSGYVDIEQNGTITCSGLDSYHATHHLMRLSYAKTDKDLEVIDRES